MICLFYFVLISHIATVFSQFLSPVRLSKTCTPADNDAMTCFTPCTCNNESVVTTFCIQKKVASAKVLLGCHIYNTLGDSKGCDMKSAKNCECYQHAEGSMVSMMTGCDKVDLYKCTGTGTCTGACTGVGPRFTNKNETFLGCRNKAKATCGQYCSGDRYPDSYPDSFPIYSGGAIYLVPLSDEKPCEECIVSGSKIESFCLNNLCKFTIDVPLQSFSTTGISSFSTKDVKNKYDVLWCPNDVDYKC